MTAKWDLTFMCQQHEKAQWIFEKLVYRNNDETDLGETIAKERPIIMVKWLGINWMDMEHTWFILSPIYSLAVSLFIIYIAMCHCCGRLVMT